MLKKALLFTVILLYIVAANAGSGSTSANAGGGYQLEYAGYMGRVAGVAAEGDIGRNGFDIAGGQRFEIVHGALGKLEVIPAIDRAHGRVVLFFKAPGGAIVYRTDNIESNSWFPGQMDQPNARVLALSFQDMNGDGLSDIAIVCGCANAEGPYAGKRYYAGDALFQNSEGFYRDWRISDKN